MKMKTMKSILLLILLCTIVTLPTYAQGGEDRPPSVLRINDAVKLALERNTLISQSNLSVGTAEAQLKSAFGSFLPSINLSAGYTRYLTDGTVVVEGTRFDNDRPDDFYRASATASLLLFDGFGRTATYNATQSTFDAAELTVEATKRQVKWQVQQGFLNALRAKQLVDLRDVELQTSLEQLERVKGLVEGGVAVISTQYFQESEAANAELSLELARTDYLVARTVLSNLMNYDPVIEFDVSADGLLDAIDSTEMGRVRATLGSFEDLFRAQLESRPDIAAARARIVAAEATVKGAKSGYYPSISASLGWGWDQSGGVASTDGTLSLGMQYPLFEGFRTNERVQIAETDVMNNQIELRRLELSARTELRQAFARLEGAEKTLMAAEKVVQSARQSRFASDERFKVGVGNYSDYLTANAQFVNARINQVNALFNYRMALYEIEYLSGK